MPDELPIACHLADEELRTREATLLQQFKSAVRSREELADGYSFELLNDRKSLSLAAEVIAAERECCPFLKFHLTTEPNLGPLRLLITGPPGTKDFLNAHFL